MTWRGALAVPVILLAACGSPGTPPPSAMTGADAVSMLRGALTFSERDDYVADTSALVNVRPADVASFGTFLQNASVAVADGRQQDASTWSMIEEDRGCSTLLVAGGGHVTVASPGATGGAAVVPAPLPITPAALADLLGTAYTPAHPGGTVALPRAATAALLSAGVALATGSRTTASRIPITTDDAASTVRVVITGQNSGVVTVNAAGTADFAAVVAGLAGGPSDGSGTPRGTLRLATHITLAFAAGGVHVTPLATAAAVAPVCGG